MSEHKSTGDIVVRCTVATLIAERGMNIEQFRLAAGISRNSARALVRGTLQNVDLDVLRRVVKCLGVQPGDIFVVEETRAA